MSKIITDFQSGCYQIGQSTSKCLSNLSQRIVVLCLKIKEFFCRLFNCKSQQSPIVNPIVQNPSIVLVSRTVIPPTGTESHNSNATNSKTETFAIPPTGTEVHHFKARNFSSREIFAISAAPDAEEKIKLYFCQLSKEDQVELLQELNDNFNDFIKWLKVMDRAIENESDDEIKKVLILEKGTKSEEIHNKNLKLQDQLICAAPTNTFYEKINRCVVPGKGLLLLQQPKGMQIYLDTHLNKNEETDHWKACDGYDDLENQLKLIRDDFTRNEWHYTVCCRDMMANNHELPVIIMREENNEFTALIVDSCGFHSIIENLYPIISLVHNSLPGVKMYSSLYCRQNDLFNCGFMTLKDLKVFRNNKNKIMDYFKNNSKKAEEFKDTLPYPGYAKATSLQRLLSDNPESVQNLWLTEGLPLELMYPNQYASKLDNLLKNPPNGTDPESLKKLERKKDIYTIYDQKANRGFYSYTKLKADKYRWNIMLHSITAGASTS